MFKIENIKKDKITTIIGILFLIADFVYFIFPFFSKGFENTIGMLITGALLGGGFLLMPDDLIKKLINKEK